MARGGSSIGHTFRPWGTVPETPWASPVLSEYWFLAFCPQELWNKPRRTWVYELDFNPILGGRQVLKSVAIKYGLGFLLTGIGGMVTDTSNPPVLQWGSGFVAAGGQPANVLLQITLAKRKYSLFSQPVPIENVIGAGLGSPGIPVPIYVTSGDVINVLAQSLAVQSLTNKIVRLSLMGVIFDTPRQDAAEAA